MLVGSFCCGTAVSVVIQGQLGSIPPEDLHVHVCKPTSYIVGLGLSLQSLRQLTMLKAGPGEVLKTTDYKLEAALI